MEESGTESPTKTNMNTNRDVSPHMPGSNSNKQIRLKVTNKKGNNELMSPTMANLPSINAAKTYIN
jgi:hypothetical protein